MSSPRRGPLLHAAIAALVVLAVVAAAGCGKRSSPKSTTLMSQGEDAVAQGRINRAVAFFEQEIELNPKNPAPYLRLALIYEHVYADRAKAGEYYEAYLEVETSEPMRERIERWRRDTSESAPAVDAGNGRNGATTDAALLNQLEEVRRTLREAEQANDDLAKRIIELDDVHRQLEEIQGQLTDSEAAIATLTNEHAGLNKLAGKRAETIAALTTEIDDLKAQQETSGDTAAKQMTQLQQQIATIEKANETLDARNKELEAENSRSGRRTLNQKLAEARRELKAAQATTKEQARTIEDLERQIARLKARAGTATTRTVKHVVKQGETLSAISLKYYGTRERWHEVHEANRDVIPDPDRIPAGLELIILLDDAE